MVTWTCRVLRVIGYPPLPEDYDTSKGLSCGAHTDYGCLTFLLADDFPGALQGKSLHSVIDSGRD